MEWDINQNDGIVCLENFMKVVEGGNVTQIASLMQKLVESHLIGHSVTETSGAIILERSSFTLLSVKRSCQWKPGVGGISTHW